MTPGTASWVALAASQAVAASTVLVILGANTTGNSFTTNLNAGSKMLVHLHLQFSVGATGGLKVQLVVPAAPTYVSQDITLQDTVTPATISSTAQTNTAFANALAVAGTHFLDFYFRIQNGVNAGALSAQVACNSAANTFTALPGTFMQCTLINS